MKSLISSKDTGETIKTMGDVPFYPAMKHLVAATHRARNSFAALLWADE